MGKCCVEGCGEASEDVEYFKFPVSKPLRLSWLAACGASGDVCAAHFAEEDYQHTRTGRRLRSGAVPRAPPRGGETASETQAQPNVDTNNTEANEKDEIEDESDESTPKITTDKEEDIIEKDNDKTKSIEDKTDPKQVEAQAAAAAAAVVKENGKGVEIPQTEEKDIEDMITNYQIKQTKTLADRLNPEPLEDLIPSIMSDPDKLDELSNKLANNLPNNAPNNMPKERVNWETQFASSLANQLANKLDSQLDGMLGGTAPIFIEVPAKDTISSRPASPEDCLMLLESVQCDIDPSSLMLPDHAPDTDSDMEITSVDRKEDPISLLTSSDEDEVIIEEPHIDTVEVSDETDEDDKPLTTLIKTKHVKTEKNGSWGMYEFYCAQCDYRTVHETEFKKHMLELEHSNTIQICPICNYTTASKAQYSRHKRKHKEERNYKCHLCKYKARHNMSLIYHLKSHNVPAERSPKFTCDRCGFSSHLKSEGLKHIKVCDEGKLYCDDCSYSTKRRSDMRRHRMRRHSIDDDDEDFRV